METTLTPEELDTRAEAAFQRMVAVYKAQLAESEDYADALIKRYRMLEDSGQGSLSRMRLRAEIEHWNDVAHSQRQALRKFISAYRNGSSFVEENA